MNGVGGNQDGFTLLETIIAFLILSLSLAVAVQTISEGGLTFRRAADIQRAALVMETLSALQIPNLKNAGETSGAIEGSEWKMSAFAIGDRLPGTLLAVDIRIAPRGKDGPVFDYSTITIAAGDQ